MKTKKASYITIAACIVMELCVGILYVWSILKADAIAFYGWDSGAANLVASYMLFAFCAGNFIGGTLNDRIGPKRACYLGALAFAGGVFLASLLGAGSSVVLFYMTYCVLGGVGAGIAYGALLSCIQKWMPHKVGMATGIATGAFGLGTVVFSPLISSMLSALTINIVLRILSIGFIVVGLIACTFIKLPDAEYLASLPIPQKKAASAVREDMPLSKAAKTLPFWFLILSTFFYNGTWNLLSPLIKDLGISRGLSSSVAVLCVSLTGILNAAGRLIMSTLSDRIGRIKTMFILDAITLFCGLTLMAIGGTGYFGVVLLTAFAYGGPSAVHPAITTDFFGIKYTGTNYGVIMLGLGFSSVFFNSVSNKLYAATGSYYMTFTMGAISAVCAFAAMMAISITLKRRNAARTGN